MILEGKVLEDFADKENNPKTYRKGQTFRAESARYNALKAKGKVGEGKEVSVSKDNK